MRRLGCVAVVLATVFGSHCWAAEPKADAPAKGVAGIWQGSLSVGALQLRQEAIITKKDDGSFTGTIASIDQGGQKLPIASITEKDGTVVFDIKITAAKFEGKLEKDDTELKGEWLQSGLKLPLTFKRAKEALVLKRPQEPKPPYPYKEEEVTIENAKASVKLAGTLTIPSGTGPFPVVSLITGSGPQNRNEELLGHKPFWIIADHLTRRGIAVLRVDDRGTGKSTGKFAEATTEDFVGDALSCVAWLKERKEINSKQIGLIGHSEGGLIAPWAANQCPDVAFIILLAGPGLPGDEILYMQGQAILKASKVSDKDLADQRKTQEALFTIVKAEKDNAVAEKKIREYVDAELAKLPEDQKKEAEKMRSAVDAQLRMIMSPWFRFFLGYDPRPNLRKVKCPVLALNGELDLQVPPKQNLSEIEKALKEGGNRDVSVMEYPKLNHLFQTCETGLVTEYGKIEETVAPQVLEKMADWIISHTKRVDP